MITTHKYTYGFEIEGGFTRSLVSQLKRYATAKGKIMHLEGDCSVNSSLRMQEGILMASNAEISIGYFKSINEMLKVMAMFKREVNYFADNSCGLHIHVGYNQDCKDLKNSVSWQAVREFQMNCEKYELLKKRLSNTYCRRHANIDEFRVAWIDARKYYAVRFHEQYNTIEFRIFSPNYTGIYLGRVIRDILGNFLKEIEKGVEINRVENIELQESRAKNMNQAYSAVVELHSENNHYHLN